jgi:TM2 domain-containing membrane protein YozV
VDERNRLFVSQLNLISANKPSEAGVYFGAEASNMRNPMLAGILSFLIPGLGQIYNGRILIGIIWLLVTGVSWIGSAGTLGWIVHIIAAWCAYSYAKDHPVRV